MQLLHILFVTFIFLQRISQGNSQTCNQNISHWRGKLSIPDKFGENLTRCVWRISVSPGNKIELVIKKLKIENNSSCIDNFLKIYEEVSTKPSLCVKKLCRIKSSYSYVSYSSRITVLAVIKRTNTFSVFKAQYQGLCNLEVKDLNGVISSPNYPNPYPSNQHCTWIFPGGYKTSLYIRNFSLPSMRGCGKTYLSVSSDPYDVRKVCARRFQSFKETYTQRVVVSFGSGENNKNSTGFYAEYSMEDIDECSLKPSKCLSNTTCINSNGSFSCICNVGYSGNGSRCTAVSLVSNNTREILTDHPKVRICNSNGTRLKCNGKNIGPPSNGNTTSRLVTGNPTSSRVNGDTTTAAVYGYSTTTGLHVNGFNCADTTNKTRCCLHERKQDVFWEDTKAGSIRTNQCPKNHTGSCSRICSKIGVWERSDMSNCTSSEIENIYNELKTRTVQKETILKKSLLLSNLTNPDRSRLYGGDIVTSIKILKHLVVSNYSRLQDFTEQDIINFTSSYSQTVSNLLDRESFAAWQGVKKIKHNALTLVTHVEEFGNLLVNRQIKIFEYKTNHSSKSIEKLYKNIELSSRVFDVNNFKSFVFKNQRHHGYEHGLIKYPKTLFESNRKTAGGQYAGIFTAIYQNLVEILNLEKKSSLWLGKNNGINSVIITAKIGGKRLRSVRNLRDPVIITFQHVKQTLKTSHHCAFLSEDGRSWLKDGCFVYSNNKTHTICECFHLTNFALLFDVHNVQKKISNNNKSILSMLSYITCSISVVSTLTAVIIFQVLRLKSNKICIHKHLAINLCLTQLIFLIAIGQKYITIKWLCKIVAVSLHFFLLAMFSWMLVEGLHMYKALIKVFGSQTQNKSLKKYFMLGYGVPLIVVSTATGVFWNDYGTGSVCWISRDIMITTLLPPIGVVILINAAILVLVVRVLVADRSHLRSKQRSVVKDIKCSLRASIILLPLLGLNWIFGFLQISADTLVLSYAFEIMNASQGFCFLIFHCCCNSEVKIALNQRSRRGKRNDYLSRQVSFTPPFRAVSSSFNEVAVEVETRSSPSHVSNKTGSNCFNEAILLNLSTVKLTEVKKSTTDE